MTHATAVRQLQAMLAAQLADDADGLRLLFADLDAAQTRFVLACAVDALTAAVRDLPGVREALAARLLRLARGDSAGPS